MAPHSSVVTWRIPGMAEPGGLLSMGSHRVEHDWSDLAAAAAAVCVCVLSCFSCVWLFATLWIAARQAPLSMGFSSQEYWSGLLCPSPDLHPEIEPKSAALQADSLPLSHWGNPKVISMYQLMTYLAKRLLRPNEFLCFRSLSSNVYYRVGTLNSIDMIFLCKLSIATWITLVNSGLS